MSFENERGGERHPDKEALSMKLAEDMAKFGTPTPCDSTRVSTVAEIKEKGLLDIENIKCNRKAKRPKG